MAKSAVLLEAMSALELRYAAERRYESSARPPASTTSLLEFCRVIDPMYERARHADVMIKHLEAVERGDLNRLMIFMPPRHSKTFHVSERFPAWCMGRKPRRQIILASYGAELAERNSRVARNLLYDERWPWPDVKIADDSAAINRWHTNQGGRVIAAGVGGAMTGFGADLLLIDDPVKGRQEADSEVMRERTWEWYVEVARTRLMPGGAVVLCQTRWHEDDLAGRLLNARGASEWTVLTMPAMAMSDDPLGRSPGAALWPEWFDLPALEEIKRDLTSDQGSRAWLALYQQNPTPDEGGMFKRQWMQRRGMCARPLLRVLVLDSAFKTGVGNDPSAIATWETDGIDYYVRDLRLGRWEYPDLRDQMLTAAALAKPDAVLIEDTAAGQSIIQELRRATALAIVPVKVTASKEARATAITPIFEAGKVTLNPDLPGLSEWIEEHAVFPNGQHDDCVDTTSIALAYLRNAVTSSTQLEQAAKASWLDAATQTGPEAHRPPDPKDRLEWSARRAEPLGTAPAERRWGS